MIGLLRLVVVGLPVTLWYSGRILWASLRRSPGLPCLCEDLPRRWARLLLRVADARVEVENLERIVPDRPQILVANHVSYFDVLALCAMLPGKYRFVGKRELTRVPLFGPAWQACGHISIDRQDKVKAMESLELARRRLVEDRPTVILFPEGTRSRTGELRSFKKGAFVLAIQTGTEVVPAAILGTREVMRKGSLMIHRGRTIRVRFGEPLPVEGLRLEDRDTLTRRAHDAVAALQGGPA
ncbi:MAG: 1-acyl-sn-glycerol-3-phosphate acyltransferase [Gemmatimonadetes bacterium]|nr:1-acyl-sn-glycerol-3-phosphate acyltransferase [Gemmatimonadota bacterium]